MLLSNRMANITFKEAALRGIAILGLLAILLLGAWGIIQLAFFISSVFSGAGGSVSTQQPAHETLTISVPSSAKADSPVTVSWNHQGGTGNYSYALSYSCATGLSMKAPVPTGAAQTVPCDTPFNYTKATNSLTITPVYSGSTDAKTTITVTSTNLSTGAVTAQASGALTVAATKAPAKPAATTKPSAPKSTYVASTHRSNLYGYPDLAVRVTSARSQNGNAAVQFVVQNIGTNVTPSNWSFIATLPSGYQYPSGPQQALYPGDKIVYTLNYSDYGSTYTYGTCNQYGPCAVGGYSGGYQPYNASAYNPYGCGNAAYGYGCAGAAAYYQGGYGQQKTVTIAVDPYNQVIEATKGNNTASATYAAY